MAIPPSSHSPDAKPSVAPTPPHRKTWFPPKIVTYSPVGALIITAPASTRGPIHERNQFPERPAGRGIKPVLARRYRRSRYGQTSRHLRRHDQDAPRRRTANLPRRQMGGLHADHTRSEEHTSELQS